MGWLGEKFGLESYELMDLYWTYWKQLYAHDPQLMHILTDRLGLTRAKAAMSYQEIADKHGINKNTVVNKLDSSIKYLIFCKKREKQQGYIEAYINRNVFCNYCKQVPEVYKINHTCSGTFFMFDCCGAKQKQKPDEAFNLAF